MQGFLWLIDEGGFFSQRAGPIILVYLYLGLSATKPIRANTYSFTIWEFSSETNSELNYLYKSLVKFLIIGVFTVLHYLSQLTALSSQLAYNWVATWVVVMALLRAVLMCVLIFRECPAGTCDGCTFHFLWESSSACPHCTEEDYHQIEGACKGGVQVLFI